MTFPLDPLFDPTPTPGQRFGSAIGTGLSEGLKMLTEDKLQKMKQERLENLLRGVSSPTELPKDKQTISDISLSQQPSDQSILALASVNPNLARLLQSQKESAAKRQEGIAKREFERAKPILGRADERSEAITQKEQSLGLMEDAIKGGNLGFFTPDNIAEITGIEGLRSPKGAQFISSGKEYFLGSLKRAGSRPNQWIEQQIQKMLPKIGRSKEANLTVLEALKSELKIEKEQLDIIDRIAQEDEEKYGYIRGNIGGRTRKALKSFADIEQKDLERRLRRLQKGNAITNKEVFMRDPKGTLRAVNKKDVKAARDAGYRME